MGAIIGGAFEAIERPKSSRQITGEIGGSLSPRKLAVHHPELRKLRLILTCDYGRPKFIKFLFRLYPICGEILRENHLNELNYAMKFVIVDELIDPTAPSAPAGSTIGRIASSPTFFDLPIQILVNSCLTSVLVLVGITYFTSFLSSSEYERWIRYQQLLTEAHNVNLSQSLDPNSSSAESTRALAQARHHALVQGVNYDDIIGLMNKPQWIVTFARCLDHIPFPISIHSGPTPPTTSLQHHFAHQPSSPSRHPLLYANFAYLEMMGHSNKQLGGCEYNFFDHSTTEADDQSGGVTLMSDAMEFGRSLRIGRNNCRHRAFPSSSPSSSSPARAPLVSHEEIFQNFQTYQPLLDGEDGVYQFMIVTHCDLTRRRNDSQYLHKIDLFAESLVPSHMPCSLPGDALALLEYFYHQDIVSTE
jgi:hypothetical protein